MVYIAYYRPNKIMLGHMSLDWDACNDELKFI